VAQLGRASAWGAEGRWFKSSRADQIFIMPGATGADFKLGLFSAFVARSKLIALPVRNNPKLWQKNEFGRRFPIGIHQQLLFEI
jgi:hypothetical protein